MRTIRSIGTTLLYALALPVVLVATWWIASAGSTDFFFPPLERILVSVGETWSGERFTADILPSLARLGTGLVLAVLVGIVLGVAAGSSKGLRDTIEPVVEFLRAVPPPVLIPILMLFLGIGDTQKVLVVFLGCLWPVLLNTIEGVRSVDEVQIDTARGYRLNAWLRLRRLTLPAASPQIIAGIRQALSVAIIHMVVSEMFAALNGLGFAIVGFQRTYKITEMWSGIIVLGLIGVLLSLIFRIVEARVLSWYLGLRKSQRGGSR